jgi:hypothetical protein
MITEVCIICCQYNIAPTGSLAPSRFTPMRKECFESIQVWFILMHTSYSERLAEEACSEAKVGSQATLVRCVFQHTHGQGTAAAMLPEGDAVLLGAFS